MFKQVSLDLKLPFEKFGEELGIPIHLSDIFFLGSTCSTNIKNDIINNHFNEYYIIHKDIDIAKLTLQQDEVDQVKWIDQHEIISKIKNHDTSMTDKTSAWQYLVKYYEWLDQKKSY